MYENYSLQPHTLWNIFCFYFLKKDKGQETSIGCATKDKRDSMWVSHLAKQHR